MRSGAFSTAGDHRVFLGVFGGAEVVSLLFCIPQAVVGHPEVTEQNKEESGQKSQQRKENPVGDTFCKHTQVLILPKKALGVFYPSWLWGILADLWFLGHFLLWGSQWGILMFLEPRIRAWWMQPVSIAPVSVGKRVYWSQETPERCSNVPEPFGAVISSESQ